MIQKSSADRVMVCEISDYQHYKASKNSNKTDVDIDTQNNTGNQTDGRADKGIDLKRPTQIDKRSDSHPDINRSVNSTSNLKGKYVEAKLKFTSIYSNIPKLQQNTSKSESESESERSIENEVISKTDSYVDTDYQTLVDITLETGRKHQIRSQLSFIGYPVVGDQKYLARQSFKYRDIALHSYFISFKHPITSQNVRQIIYSEYILVLFLLFSIY